MSLPSLILRSVSDKLSFFTSICKSIVPSISFSGKSIIKPGLPGIKSVGSESEIQPLLNGFLNSANISPVLEPFLKITFVPLIPKLKRATILLFLSVFMSLIKAVPRLKKYNS